MAEESRFQPLIFMAPSLSVLLLSGQMRSGSIDCVKPRPEHSGQAPHGVLKENRRGSISSIEMPQSGQAYLEE